MHQRGDVRLGDLKRSRNLGRAGMGMAKYGRVIAQIEQHVHTHSVTPIEPRLHGGDVAVGAVALVPARKDTIPAAHARAMRADGDCVLLVREKAHGRQRESK